MSVCHVLSDKNDKSGDDFKYFAGTAVMTDRVAQNLKKVTHIRASNCAIKIGFTLFQQGNIQIVGMHDF